MSALSLRGKKPVCLLPLIVLLFAAPGSWAGAQGVPPVRQRLESLDAKRLASIASATKLPSGVKRSPQLDSVISQLRKGNAKDAVADWRSFINENRKLDLKPGDIDILVQWVLRESYLEANADLKDAADKVRYFTEQKKKMRDEIAQGRTDLLEAQPWPRGRLVAVFRTRYVKGADPVEKQDKRNVDKKALSAILAEYDLQLSSLDDDEQLANIDLQNNLQKQQQTLQMISQVSKQLHDTAMAVIRKIGG